MYGKLAMTCFKYQVHLYGSEAMTYLNAILWVVTEPALYGRGTITYTTTISKQRV
jgi:hypothetical protein